MQVNCLVSSHHSYGNPLWFTCFDSKPSSSDPRYQTLADQPFIAIEASNRKWISIGLLWWKQSKPTSTLCPLKLAILESKPALCLNYKICNFLIICILHTDLHHGGYCWFYWIFTNVHCWRQITNTFCLCSYRLQLRQIWSKSFSRYWENCHFRFFLCRSPSNIYLFEKRKIVPINDQNVVIH